MAADSLGSGLMQKPITPNYFWLNCNLAFRCKTY